MEPMMKKRIEMIFETTRVQHTLYVLRSGPAAGGALADAACCCCWTSNETGDLWLYPRVSLISLSVSLGWPKGSLAGSHPDVGRGGWWTRRRALTSSRWPPSNHIDRRRKKWGAKRKKEDSRIFFRFRRWDIKRGGRSTGLIHYSLYKCAWCVRLVRLVDASEPPVL